MLLERMMRAARLDTRFYEEVEHDINATSQAAMVVAIVAAANGIGGLLAIVVDVLIGEAISRALGMGGSNAAGTGAAIFSLVLWMLFFVIGWVVWAYLTYFIGTSVFKGTATPGEMLRTLGFATSPLALGGLYFIPCLGPIAYVAGAVWMVVAGVIAVRQALDFTTDKAIITILIALIPIALLWALRVALLLATGFAMSVMG